MAISNSYGSICSITRGYYWISPVLLLYSESTREVSIHPASYDHGEDHGGDLCCALTATAKIKQITCVLPGNWWLIALAKKCAFYTQQNPSNTNIKPLRAHKPCFLIVIMGDYLTTHLKTASAKTYNVMLFVTPKRLRNNETGIREKGFSMLERTASAWPHGGAGRSGWAGFFRVNAKLYLVGGFNHLETY